MPIIKQGPEMIKVEPKLFRLAPPDIVKRLKARADRVKTTAPTNSYFQASIRVKVSTSEGIL